jgi:hypothetical protein
MNLFDNILTYILKNITIHFDFDGWRRSLKLVRDAVGPI